MNHVIEHLPDPGTTIASLAAFLSPGGYLQGQTPAADSLERRVFGRRWSGYHSPRHTVVFSRSGLRQLFGRAGLHQVKINRAFNPAAITFSLAATLHPSSRGIPRHGPVWLGWLAAATLLAPFDLIGGRGAIIDFRTKRPDPS